MVNPTPSATRRITRDLGSSSVSPRRTFGLLAVSLGLALTAAACGSDSASAPAATSAADAGAGVLALQAPAADGSVIDLADYAGQDLVLWFWAPW